MTRLLAPFVPFFLAFALLAPSAPAVAEEAESPAEAPVESPAEAPAEAPKADPVPPLASDEQAAAALERFETEYKAKGLKGDERLMARRFALKNVCEIQHPEVLEAIAKVALKERNEDVRTVALRYLGRQRALPAHAGKAVVKAMHKWRKDDVMVLTGLQAIVELRYLLADDLLRDLMKHRDYGVQRATFEAAGQLQDMRLLDDLYAYVKELKAADGDSWEGASATVDTGTAGDKDQKAAEAKAKTEAAQNKGAGRRGGGGNKRDVGPAVIAAIKALTGEDFLTGEQAKTWLAENEAAVAAAKAQVAAEAEAQAESLKKK